MNQNTDGIQIDGQLLDGSTLAAIATFMEGVRSSGLHRKLVKDVPLKNQFAWELDCLALLVDTLVLRRHLVLPVKPEVTGVFKALSPLLSHDCVRFLPYEAKLHIPVLKDLEDLYKVFPEVAGRLWNFTDTLYEIPEYSLRPEIRSYMWNYTIVGDTLPDECLRTYRLLPKTFFGQGDREWSYEYYLKGIYYDLVARSVGADYAPHPARAPFMVAFDHALHPTSSVAPAILKTLSDFVTQLPDPLNVGGLAVPPLLAYVLTRARSREEILEIMLALRDNPLCAEFRETIENAAAAMTAGTNRLNMAQYCSELQRMLDNLKRELGLHDAKAEVHVWLFKVPIRLPNFLYKTVHVGKLAHLNWLRDIAKTLASHSSIEARLQHLFKDKIE